MMGEGASARRALAYLLPGAHHLASSITHARTHITMQMLCRLVHGKSERKLRDALVANPLAAVLSQAASASGAQQQVRGVQPSPAAAFPGLPAVPARPQESPGAPREGAAPGRGA